jgi:hypothetical protein
MSLIQLWSWSADATVRVSRLLLATASNRFSATSVIIRPCSQESIQNRIVFPSPRDMMVEALKKAIETSSTLNIEVPRVENGLSCTTTSIVASVLYP